MKNLKFKRKETKKQQSSGITLIALVITIIVLVILAGISITMLSGDNGILQKATDAKKQNGKAQISEELQVAITNLGINYHTKKIEEKFKDYIFDNIPLLREYLGTTENELTADEEKSEITYKNVIYDVTDDGKVSERILIKSIEIATTEEIIEKNDTLTLNIIKFPSNATEKVKWISENQEIAIVDSVTGEITGVAEGTATIKVTNQSGTIVSDNVCNVNVTAPALEGDYVRYNVTYKDVYRYTNNNENDENIKVYKDYTPDTGWRLLNRKKNSADNRKWDLEIISTRNASKFVL